MGNVLLIGGSPMIGKSTVARKIAAEFEISCISTDDIGEALQTVADINPMVGKYYLDYYRDKSVDELIEDLKTYHKNIEKAIDRLTEVHIGWGNSIIMEGYAIYPNITKRLESENLKSIWLIAKEELLQNRLEIRSDFKRTSENAGRNYLLRSCWHNAFILDECKKNDCNYLVIDGTETIEDIKERILQITEYNG